VSTQSFSTWKVVVKHVKMLKPSEPNNRQIQASIRRQQILEAAVRLFAQKGIAKTTTRQIAQKAGVAEGLIFRYFPTKLNLVRAVTGTPHVILGDLRKILEDAQARPVEEVMGQIATVWLELLRREADITSIMFGEALTNPEIGGVLYQVIEEGSARIGKFLDASKKAGRIAKSVDTKTITHIYMSSILMFFIRYRDLSENDWKKESASFANKLASVWLRMAARR